MDIIKHENHLPVYTSRKIKLIAVIKQFIKAAVNGEILTRNGDRYTSGTIRTYLTFMLTIERYEKEFGTVFIDDVNLMWVEYYRAFLIQMDMSKNSVATNLGKLKALMNRAYLAGITQRSGQGIKAPAELTVQVYLTWSELRHLYYFELENIGEKRIRDVFIMNCFLGMRISDFLNFVRSPKSYISNIDGKEFIQYFAKKTGSKSVIPMHTMVRKILERNNYNFSRKFSYQHYNKYLKKICKIAGMTELVRVIYTKGGIRIEKEVEKYTMISSHTARRTFASLAELAKINRPAIMKITGHKTENAFLSYIRISELDSAISIYDHEFFKTEL